MGKLTFGMKLKQLREAKGLSQDKLGEVSGVNVRAIRTYEQEQRVPSAEYLFMLSEALGVDCSAFKGCEFGNDSQQGQDAKGSKKPKKGK